MALAVKMDIAFNPVNVNLLGANAVMLDAQLVAHLIQQFGRFYRGAFIRKIRVCQIFTSIKNKALKDERQLIHLEGAYIGIL